MPEGEIAVSTLRFPLVVVEFRGAASDVQFRDYLAAVDAASKRAASEGRRIAMVVDTLQATRAVTASQRRMQVDWVKASFERSEHVMAGMAFVIDNALVRGVLTAILWVQSLPCPYTTSGARAEAEQWALERIAATSQPTAADP